MWERARDKYLILSVMKEQERTADETNWLASNLQLALYWIKYSSGGLIIPTPYTMLDE